MAWHMPAAMAKTNSSIAPPHGSKVLHEQRRLAARTRKTLSAIVSDVHDGLAETVGVSVTMEENERTSVVIALPALKGEVTPEHIARAIDAENVEAWCDERGRVHVAISPWYSTKDVDQVVLSVTKVVHVLLGLHAADATQTTEGAVFWRRWLSVAMEIAALQKQQSRR